MDRTISNGGLKEESSIVINNGTVVQGETGSLPTIVNGIQTATASLPNLSIGQCPLMRKQQLDRADLQSVR